MHIGYIAYFLSACIIFLHTHTQISSYPKQNFTQVYSKNSRGRVFTLKKANFKWASQIQNKEFQIAKSSLTQSNVTSQRSYYVKISRDTHFTLWLFPQKCSLCMRLTLARWVHISQLHKQSLTVYLWITV